MKLAIGLAIGLVVSAFTSPAHAQRLSGPDAAKVSAAGQAYAAAWLKGDADAIMACFTDDAVLMPHHGDDPKVGKAAILEHFWPIDFPPFTVTRMAMSPDEIDGSGEFAFARGRFSLSLWFEHEGKKTTISSEGNYMMVFRKGGDGEWRISRYIWNDPVPQVE